jgi:hypothetical protein
MMPRWFARALFVVMLLVVMLLVARHAFADDPPQTMIRAHLEPGGAVIAGTEVKLVVDALTTTWFTAAPDWPLFTVPDAIVALPDEQAVNLSETSDGVRWFGVSRAYRIVPRAAKTFDLAPFDLTVFPGGGANVPVRLKTPRLKLTATLPPGAEGMTSFFPLPKLTATQKIEPAKTRLKVGDTITRTITQTASGTESMLIPPVGFADIEGMRRYPKTPQTPNVVQDRAGLVAGERTDSAAYVVNRSGRYTLPPVTIEWWNTATNKRESIVLPAVSFSAARAKEKPLFEIPVDAMSKAASHTVIFIDGTRIAYGVALFAGGFALVWSYPRLARLAAAMRGRIREARRRRAQGDAPAWRALRAAGRTGAVRRIVPALYRWIDKRPEFGRPARVQNIAAAGVPALTKFTASVAEDYAGKPDATIEWNEVERELKQAAKRRAKRDPKRALPPLNEA